jgi:hypothetical protein
MPIKKKSKVYTISRKSVYLALAVLAGIILCISAYLVFHTDTKGINLEYTVKPLSQKEKTVKVELEISNIPEGKKIQLYDGDVNSFDQSCTNADSSKVAFERKDGIIEIAGDDSKFIRLIYSVKLGEPGKHGHGGDFSKDLLTFSGEQAILFPVEAYSIDENDIKGKLGGISIKYDIPEGWKSIVPYATKKKGNIISKTDKLSWNTFLDLRKECYAFGKFEAYEYKKGKGKFTIYADTALNNKINDEIKQGLNGLYDYYSKLFGYELPEYSIVLLRKDPEDSLYIMGGSATQTIGATFDNENLRDWELMGHRLFHAFFDKKVNIHEFHAAPNVWFYEGLATYYENMSMKALPESIKVRLGIDSEESFKLLYKKYLYMSLKDAHTLSIAPMDEEKFQNSQGMEEFLHYTQAPLVIKTIEESSVLKGNTPDKMLKYILEHSNERNLLTVSNIIHEALGDVTNEFAQKYIFGKEILPLDFDNGENPENAEQVINSLNLMEYTLWTWFNSENPNYPLDKLGTLGLETLTQEAEKVGVHFASDDIENKVKRVSPTVYSLLKQYALRAQVCNARFEDENLRLELLGNNVNISVWEEFVKHLKVTK